MIKFLEPFEDDRTSPIVESRLSFAWASRGKRSWWKETKGNCCASILTTDQLGSLDIQTPPVQIKPHPVFSYFYCSLPATKSLPAFLLLSYPFNLTNVSSSPFCLIVFFSSPYTTFEGIVCLFARSHQISLEHTTTRSLTVKRDRHSINSRFLMSSNFNQFNHPSGFFFGLSVCKGRNATYIHLSGNRQFDPLQLLCSPSFPTELYDITPTCSQILF